MRKFLAKKQYLFSENTNFGFTLFELLVVISIIGLLTVPVLIIYKSARTSRALDSSASQFADNLRTAHIYAREANGKKGWGILRKDETSYSFVSGSKDSWEIDSTYSLERGISFKDDFFIWFDIGTGEVDEEKKIIIENPDAGQIDVTVLKTGVVEITRQ